MGRKKNIDAPFDHKASFGRVTSDDEGMISVAFRQGGYYYDSQYNPVCEVPGWSDKRAAEAEAAEKAEEARQAAATAAAAESILGDLGAVADPNAEASKENAAAAAAEENSDDA
jgi:hypothetical protein